MQPQIFMAGHDEQLGLADPATKPAAAQAARYRSEVRRFVEALAAGRLDEDLVPEIETAFAELGRVAKLDFEAVRREVAEPSEAVRREVAGPSPSLAQTSRERTRARSGRPSDAVLVSELPDVFGWRDVAQAWSLGRAGAFARLEKLLEEHLIRGAGHGRYSPIVPKSKVQSPESKSPKVQKQPIRPEKSKVQSPKSRVQSRSHRRNRPSAKPSACAWKPTAKKRSCYEAIPSPIRTRSGERVWGASSTADYGEGRAGFSARRIESGLRSGWGFLPIPPKRCNSGVGRVGGAPPIIAIIAS